MKGGTSESRSAFLRLAILLAALVLLPALVRPIIAAEIWIFAIAAMALNLIFGYTGMLSFGQATFFGMGAYTAGLMMIHWKAPLLLCLVSGALTGAITAAVIGSLCIQRLGIYFIAYKWTDLTGGDDGLPGIPRPPLALGPFSVAIDTSLRYYIFVAVLFLLLFYAMKRIVESPFGLICQS